MPRSTMPSMGTRNTVAGPDGTFVSTAGDASPRTPASSFHTLLLNKQ